MGIGLLADRFAMKDVKRKQDKNKSKNTEEKSSAKNEMKSSKFFRKMEEIAKSDAIKKENKKKAKLDNTGSAFVNHGNMPTKRFKL